MTAAPDAVGFYGKLPALGDFVTRRVSRDFVAPWDDWLQFSMASSRAQLGERWLESYLRSPLWRFVLAPGVVDGQLWTGVLMPSMDRVRRYFPLTLTVALPASVNPFALAAHQAWYEAAEELLLSVLDGEQFVLDEFDAEVAAMGIPEFQGAPVADAQAMAVDAAGLRLAMDASGDPSAAMLLLADVLARRCHGSYSLWWSTGSEQVEPSLLACQGLPSPEGFGAMLEGGWEAGGWSVYASGSVDSTVSERSA